MPDVKVRYGGPEVNEAAYALLFKLVTVLPEIVATALHVEKNTDAHVTPDKVAVDLDKQPPTRINRKNVEIRIETKDFPERKKKVAGRDRRQEIEDAVRLYIPSQLSLDVCIIFVDIEYA